MIYPAGVVHRPFDPVFLGQFFPDADSYWDGGGSADSAFAHQYAGFNSNIPPPGSQATGALGTCYIGWLCSQVSMSYSDVSNTPNPSLFDIVTFNGVPRPHPERIPGSVSVGNKTYNDPMAPRTWILVGTCERWNFANGVYTQTETETYLEMSLYGRPAMRIPRANGIPVAATITFNGSTWSKPSNIGNRTWIISTVNIFHY